MVHKRGAMIKSLNRFPMQNPCLSHLNQQVIGSPMGAVTTFACASVMRSQRLPMPRQSGQSNGPYDAEAK